MKDYWKNFLGFMWKQKILYFFYYLLYINYNIHQLLYNTSGYLKFRGRIEHEDDENLRNIINGCMINTEMPN